MKNRHEFSLIDGEFTKDEALEIVLNLFKRKIQFHEIKNFSSQERFGREDLNALNRISQLKESIQHISNNIKDVEITDDAIVLKANVIFSFSNFNK